MRLATLEMLRAAYGRYALGAFNVCNMEQIRGLFRGAAKAHAPIIVQFTRVIRNYADPAMLRQVLHNLFQNAIDALTGVENPRILVNTSMGTGGVLLTVRDNGTGIAEGVMGRIFEPYVTTKPKGTGLGLAIVKKIVDEHHGRILVENVKPHGATVSIVLPSKAA